MDLRLGGGPETQTAQRPTGEAMRRGFLGRCPSCGSGRLFRSFAKTVDDCSVCGEHIAHHRADDLPAYLTIFIVGHIVVAGFMIVEAATYLPGWIHLAIWVPITILLALVLLQPLKGATIGLQWAKRMHGFGGRDEDAEAAGVEVRHYG